jgi:hypothetical protein
MTPQDALCELLARLGASNGATILVSEEELSRWPTSVIKAMKSQKLLVKSRLAVSVVCDGCERECVMPVYTLSSESRGAASFVVCDKRDDINRVDVPSKRLVQWQASATAIADLITSLLGLRRPDPSEATAGRWEIGVLKGGKGSSHLVLLADGTLKLTLAGHSIGLADILELESNGLKLDKRTLVQLVDKPIAGAGDTESATQRRARLKKRVQTEKNKGNKSFLKAVAQEEGISVSRLKQLLQKEHQPVKTKLQRPVY